MSFNIFEKAQIIQFLIILFMKNYSDEYKSKIDYNKDILVDISYYKTNIYNIFKNKLEIVNENNKKDNIENIIKNTDYFYFFNSSKLKVYFYKKKDTNEHIIFFDGLKKIKDIMNLLINIIQTKNNHYIFDILNNNGILYSIQNTLINKEKLNNIFESFLFIQEKYYNKNDTINIYGYSLGGPLSYLFYDILEKNNFIENIKINITSIESWFEGNKELYDKIKKNNNYKTIFSKGSFMFLYKNIFQKSIDNYILIEKDNEDNLTDYTMNLFPFGLIDYFKDNHSLNKIIK
jgi:hypothetical protein